MHNKQHYSFEKTDVRGQKFLKPHNMIKRLIKKLKALCLYFVSKNEAVIFCENDFSTCVHQSFNKCTLKEKCPSQK